MKNEIIVHYREGYKGQTAKTLRNVPTPIHPETAIKTEYIEMTTDGLLTVLSGYPTDFASGPTLDWNE